MEFKYATFQHNHGTDLYIMSPTRLSLAVAAQIRKIINLTDNLQRVVFWMSAPLLEPGMEGFLHEIRIHLCSKGIKTVIHDQNGGMHETPAPVMPPAPCPCPQLKKQNDIDHGQGRKREKRLDKSTSCPEIISENDISTMLGKWSKRIYSPAKCCCLYGKD